MAWGMIGGAAVSVVGGALLGHSNSSSAGQQASNPTASGAANNPTVVADPFASQRYQYQKPLSQLMADQQLNDRNSPAEQMMNFYATGGNSQALFDKAAKMMDPGYQFNSADPSYQFRLDQGSKNINRNAAAGGALSSGNVLAALQDYGQQSASQEFQNEYNRRMGLATAVAGQDAQGFAEANQLDQNTMNQFQGQYARLAQLAGANTGSPTAAASSLTNQQAGAAAQVDKWGNLLGKAGTAIWDYATGGGSDSGSDSSSTDYSTPTDYASQLFPTLYSGTGGSNFGGLNW